MLRRERVGRDEGPVGLTRPATCAQIGGESAQRRRLDVQRTHLARGREWSVRRDTACGLGGAV